MLLCMDCGVGSCVISGSIGIFALWRKVWAWLSLIEWACHFWSILFSIFSAHKFFCSILTERVVSVSSCYFEISCLFLWELQAVSHAQTVPDWVKRSQKEASGGLSTWPGLCSVLNLVTWEKITELFFPIW